ncbi:NEDD8 ultimate buster 1-like [Hydractinia symbiolongicarpus]|uniref:NEDD8 ultimate buster 1-like n=1 Tax=Hydractinia symbiolongicarpus TaxID=13093 RepID=UPI00254F6728|nr:NEDD8 ultimate buster 1-like [Hydractinia symbiolongicarpus]
MASINTREVFAEKICIVRSKLNKEKIKLWLPPFTTENGEKGDVPMDLVIRFVNELRIPEEIILQIFEQLRIHAISKLKSRETFTSTGIATLHLHLQWVDSNSRRQKMDTTVAIKLDESGSHLCEMLQKEVLTDEFNLESMRMIHKGRIIDHGTSLSTQNVTNGANIMVILTLKQSYSCDDEVSTSNRAAETKKIVEALAKRTDGGRGKHDHFFLEINDQQGNKIHLPEEERKSLSVAMTLHEKGRVLLKQKKFLESLSMFLEADQEFRNCRSELLNAVDNYAVLCLDIVWCYFSLQKLDYLPDAEEKLRVCKDCLSKSYGPNLERLTFVKGSDMNELALFVRVHLLEAICNYLRGNNEEASDALNKAEVHIKRLEVDDDKFSQLVSMGFSTREARLSLRACRGDVTLAIEWISRRKEEMLARKERERKEKEDRKSARKFGWTTSGDLVNMEYVRNLTEMGFCHEISLAAIKRSNNNINDALEILQNNPDTLLMEQTSFPKHMTQQFVAIGFPLPLVEKTLKKWNGDVNKCMEELLKQQTEKSTNLNNDASPSAAIDNETENSSSMEAYDENSISDESSDEDDNEIDLKVAETLKDIAQNPDDDYLDLTLEEEAELLNKYRLLIATSSQN